MPRHTQRKSSNDSVNNDGAFDLSQIFIGRLQQLDFFEMYLNRWKKLIFDADPDDPLVTEAPSPNNKIQGLVVLLYGRGGFGKSTLLRRYHRMASKENQNFLPSIITVSGVIDWEFAVEGKRRLFNPPRGQEVDAPEYFQVLCGQLAIALGKKLQEFKAYQSAIKDVEKARKEAVGLLDRLRRDDSSAEIRDMTVDVLATALSIVTPPPVSKILDNEKVKEAAREGVKISGELLARVKQKLHDRLSGRLDDFLEPALRLGLALGHDLHEFAKDYPLLIFFDTYEEIDEGDRYLRMAMGAAGLRVGWVIAGRDNLWAGSGQTERSMALEYGYKDVVPADRGLAVDFNVGGVGAFTVSDIKDYFDLLCRKVQYAPPLPKVPVQGAKRILDVTGGVPLAVKIAADLYMNTADLDAVTENVESKREIIDQMVRRYLLHARDSQSERAKLYGLAMLRRADQSAAVAAALGLTPEQAKTHYRTELRHMHRRYSFIFTEKEKEEPTLHEEVRTFLRLWLLERYRQPEIGAVSERLKETYESFLKKLEDQRKYRSLKARLEDEQWVGIYLDMTMQQFWLDPGEGVRYALPFMIAASAYRPSASLDVAAIGQFFEAKIEAPYADWWKWSAQSLVSTSTLLVRFQLEELTSVALEQKIGFPRPLPNYQSELEALLWWHLGGTYHYTDDYKALEWYEKALSRLVQERELKNAAAQAYMSVFYQLYEQKKYAESMSFLDREIELWPDFAHSYVDRGVTYNNLAYKDTDPANRDATYQQAIEDFNRAIELNPQDARTYANRGNTYYNLRQYDQAIKDLNQAIELDPKFAYAYIRRGDTYNNLKQYDQALRDHNYAIELTPGDADAYYCRGFTHLWQSNAFLARADYSRSHQLDPMDVNAAWMVEWTSMGKEIVGIEVAKRLEDIAPIDPEHYVAYICRGLSLGLRGKLKEGLAEIERAIPLSPEGDAYFWKGMLCAYYYRGRYQIAIEALEKSLENGLPSLLLTPLYWLEKVRPDFFEKYAKPLLEKYTV